MSESQNGRSRSRAKKPQTIKGEIVAIDGVPVQVSPLRKKNGRPFALPGPEENKESYLGTLKTLSGLGAIMATSKECAAVLGVTEKTLYAFYERNPEAHDAWVSGKEQGKSSLRRMQFDVAKKNATMGIFLGLNYLDQKDFRKSGDQVNNVQANAVTIVQFGDIEGKL